MWMWIACEYMGMLKIHCYINYEDVFVDISKEALPKRRIWVNIKSLVFVKEL